MNKKRIVSLFPAATEIIFALEIDKLLIGRSHECNFPYYAKQVRPLSRPKWGVNNTGEEADEIVSDLFNASFSPYDVHVEALKKMKPNVIITSSMREDCGLSEEDLIELTKTELGYPVEVIDVQINSVEDMFATITKIGEAIDVEGRAKRYIKLLKNRIKHISVLTEQMDIQKQILFLEWLNPMMVAGGWIPDLIEITGAVHLLTSIGDKAQKVSFDELKNLDPEVIILGSRGLKIDEIMDEIGKMEDYPKWEELDAVRNKQVFVVDSADHFTKPGPRLIDSLEVLCDMFYPKNFLFGHKGKNFVPVRF